MRPQMTFCVKNKIHRSPIRLTMAVDIAICPMLRHFPGIHGFQARFSGRQVNIIRNIIMV